MGTRALRDVGTHQPVIAVVCSYEYQAQGLRNIDSMEIVMYMNLYTIYAMPVFDIFRIFLPSTGREIFPTQSDFRQRFTGLGS